jgi:hypothetical protein
VALTRSTSLDNYSFADIDGFTGIDGLSRLRDLTFWGLPPHLTAHDWDQIERARSVHGLTLRHVPLVSLHNSRACLSGITRVTLHSTEVQDLAPLAEAFPGAEDVFVDCPGAVDVAPLANLPNLKRTTVVAPTVLNAERLKGLEGVELSLPAQSRY